MINWFFRKLRTFKRSQKIIPPPIDRPTCMINIIPAEGGTILEHILIDPDSNNQISKQLYIITDNRRLRSIITKIVAESQYV
jgi:hypothetical protein